MAYIQTIDERSNGTFINRPAGYWDAPNTTSTTYTLAEGYFNAAYGATILNSGLVDSDAYNLGYLDRGRYTVYATGNNWDYFNSLNGIWTPSVSVYTSLGVPVIPDSFGSATFDVVTGGGYIISVSGNYFSDEYRVYYSKAPLPNSPAILDGQIVGSFIVNSTLEVGGSLIDPDGTGLFPFSYTWYSSSDGFNWTLIGNQSSYTIKPSDQGKFIDVKIEFYDNVGNLELVSPTPVFVAASDTTAPNVSTFSPTDGATGVAVGSNIVLTFSEVIQKGAGLIQLRLGSATGTVVETFDAATSARLTLSGSQLTIDPTSNLANGTQYFVTFASGSIKDIAGNSFTGTSTYDFTTIATENLLPTYALSTSASVNEGSTATFILTTTNVAAGTQVAYMLSGVSSADVEGGSLSGTAIVDSNGQATISVALLADSLTEGAETLTVTAASQTASTIVNDTSTGVSTTVTSYLAADMTDINFYNIIVNSYDSEVSSNFEFNGYLYPDVLAFKYQIGSIEYALIFGGYDLEYFDYEGFKVITGGTATGFLQLYWNGVSFEPLQLTEAMNVSAVELFSAFVTPSTDDDVLITQLVLAGNDTIQGSAYNDVLVGYGGDDTMYGGIGSDTAVFTGARNQYSISGNGAFLTVADNNVDRDGVDTLWDFEFLRFSDQTISTTELPTYALSSAVSANEGSTATFTLTTTNVAAGTQVAYTLSGISAADVQDGALTGTATIDSNGHATISVAIVADSLTEGAETLTLTAAGQTASTIVNDTSTGSSNVQPGTSGNDTFRITSGSNSIDGGAGADTVQYESTRSATSIVYSNGVITVERADGIDTITNVERIEFTDGDLVFDVSSANAPAAYRLYGGAFDRTPDEGGFRFWTNTLDLNYTLHHVSAQFINSPEFIDRYGPSLSNPAFVDALYLNVLHRGGDSGGIAHWNRMLDNNYQDRADVLVEFTQLPEFVGISAENINNGYWVV